MAKSRDAFRTISEVAEAMDLPAHVLRFWESKFSQIRPVKRAGGRRYYRPDDVALLAGIQVLLHQRGLTIKGAQRLIREEGMRHVMALGKSAAPDAGQEAHRDPAKTQPIAAPLAQEPAKPTPAAKPPAPAASDNVVPFSREEQLMLFDAPPPAAVTAPTSTADPKPRGLAFVAVARPEALLRKREKLRILVSRIEAVLSAD